LTPPIVLAQVVAFKMYAITHYSATLRWLDTVQYDDLLYTGWTKKLNPIIFTPIVILILNR